MVPPSACDGLALYDMHRVVTDLGERQRWRRRIDDVRDDAALICAGVLVAGERVVCGVAQCSVGVIALLSTLTGRTEASVPDL